MDVRLRDPQGNVSQIDLVAGLFSPLYCECKCYSGPVPLSDVAKFASVLDLNRIPRSRGIFVTNSRYVPRARELGVRTVDGDELELWKQRARRRMLLRWTLGTVAMSVAGLLALPHLMDVHD